MNPSWAKGKHVGRRGLPAEAVAAMHADWLALGSFAVVGRKWGRKAGTIRDILSGRGLVKTDPDHSRRAKAIRRHNGTFVAGTPATPAQIEEMIAGLDRMKIPTALKWEWRAWSHAQRSDFVHKLRKKFPSQRPTGPFSANVEPFDYTTPRAHELAKAANAGHNSQTMPVKLKVASEGVIWRGKVYFWALKIGYQPGPFDPVHGRPPLHHLIWEHHHGRPVPAKTTVILQDGNWNNLAPENLALRTMAECAQMNSVQSRLKADPTNPELLAKADRRIAASNQTRTQSSRSLTGLLVARFNQKQTHENDLTHALARKHRRNVR